VSLICCFLWVHSKDDYLFNQFLKSVICFCLFLSFFAIAADNIIEDYEIKGISGELENNVALYLKPLVGEKPTRSLRRYAKSQVEDSLKALGYYSSNVTIDFNKEHELVATIERGSATRIETLNISVNGEAKHDPLIQQVIESLDPSQADAILQSVLTTGRIADGEYTFEIQVRSESDQVYVSDSKTIVVQSPVSINLEMPGGVLSDTLDNVIYSTFPIFQWFSQSCNGCESYIRVAQYNSDVHSSLEDAIEDQRVLPFDQTEDWYLIDNINSFQYPFSGAYPLEEGKVYGWQVMMTLPTTSGAEEMASSIFAFKIGVAGTVETTGAISSPILMTLQQALGDDQFNAFFGSGNELQGYTPTGQLEINGINVDEAMVNYLLNQILSNTYQVQSITVE